MMKTITILNRDVKIVLHNSKKQTGFVESQSNQTAWGKQYSKHSILKAKSTEVPTKLGTNRIKLQEPYSNMVQHQGCYPGAQTSQTFSSQGNQPSQASQLYPNLSCHAEEQKDLTYNPTAKSQIRKAVVLGEVQGSMDLDTPKEVAPIEESPKLLPTKMNLTSPEMTRSSNTIDRSVDISPTTRQITICFYAFPGHL